MSSRYTVTITRRDLDVPFRDKEYQVINEQDNGKKIYDYVYSDSTHDVDTKIFDQTVDELDMTAVIKAVNGL